MQPNNGPSDTLEAARPSLRSSGPLSRSLRNLSRQVQIPDGYIRLSGPLEHDNIVNGDGLRAVVWTQGCPNHCRGCQNPETWDYASGFLIKIDEIKEELRKFKGQAGLTFCGPGIILTRKIN